MNFRGVKGSKRHIQGSSRGWGGLNNLSRDKNSRGRGDNFPSLGGGYGFFLELHNEQFFGLMSSHSYSRIGSQKYTLAFQAPTSSALFPLPAHEFLGSVYMEKAGRGPGDSQYYTEYHDRLIANCHPFSLKIVTSQGSHKTEMYSKRNTFLIPFPATFPCYMNNKLY